MDIFFCFCHILNSYSAIPIETGDFPLYRGAMPVDPGNLISFNHYERIKSMIADYGRIGDFRPAS